MDSSLVKVKRAAAICHAMMVALCASAADIPLEFAGYLRAKGRPDLFVITDRSRDVTSEWIGVGQTFADFTIVEFISDRDTLVVEKHGQRRELPLKDSRSLIGHAQMDVSIIRVDLALLEDGKVLTSGKVLPLEALRGYLQLLADQRPRAKFRYSVSVAPAADVALMESLKAQLVAAITAVRSASSDAVVKLQPAPPPNK